MRAETGYQMNMVIKKKYGSYQFGMSAELSDRELRQLVDIFESPKVSNGSPLGGRQAVSRVCLESAGDVVVKQYTRGGMIRHIMTERYLRLGKTRCQEEFEQMVNVRQMGISVPEPVAYAFTGNMFYKGWIVTREIKNHRTLAAISLENPERCGMLADKVCGQIMTLAGNRIFHVDLHPGNIIVDAYDNVFIVDFDKTRVSGNTRENLLKRYADRWERAVRKHGLPEILIGSMRGCFSQGED